jgi:hypothetical protein
MDLPDWKTGVGYLSVIAALALSLPGVRAVRADDEAVPVVSVRLVDPALSCDPTHESDATTTVKVFLGNSSDRSEGSQPIALNTQGYSYRPPAVDPDARRLERH